MTKEALKLALKALEADELDMVDDGNGNMVFRKEQAITAIKEALAQPEPVAWEQFYPEMGKPKLAYLSPTESPDNACYTPPQRTWVGLTDIDYAGLPLEQAGLVRWAEAKLRSKNT